MNQYTALVKCMQLTADFDDLMRQRRCKVRLTPNTLDECRALLTDRRMKDISYVIQTAIEAYEYLMKFLK